MTNLQTALDARLAALKGNKISNKQTLVNQNISTEAIKASLRGAGILDRKNRVVQLVTFK